MIIIVHFSCNTNVHFAETPMFVPSLKYKWSYPMKHECLFLPRITNVLSCWNTNILSCSEMFVPVEIWKFIIVEIQMFIPARNTSVHSYWNTNVYFCTEIRCSFLLLFHTQIRTFILNPSLKSPVFNHSPAMGKLVIKYSKVIRCSWYNGPYYNATRKPYHLSPFANVFWNSKINFSYFFISPS